MKKHNSIQNQHILVQEELIISSSLHKCSTKIVIETRFSESLPKKFQCLMTCIGGKYPDLVQSTGTTLQKDQMCLALNNSCANKTAFQYIIVLSKIFAAELKPLTLMLEPIQGLMLEWE